MNIYSTDHSVLADPKDIPWLATLPPSSNLPSKENVEHATEESDGRSQWFDDGCGKKLYWENVPVYAVHGQEGLKGSSSNFELTWENEDAKNDCTAPAEKSELFVNIGAEHEDNLGDRDTTSWIYWSRALQQNQAYYIAVPNEKYLLLIQHFIYKFPYFLRDENGLPVPEVEEESKKSSEYTDIRSIPFEDLTSNPENPEGVKPYVPGCACAIDGDHTDIISASSVASSGWSKSSTSGPWGADQSHSAFTQAFTTGSGTGALFSVTTDGGGIPTFTWVTGGFDYEVSDTLTFTDPYGLTEVCVLYVSEVTPPSEGVSWTGTTGSMVCAINHGLDTEYITATVMDKDKVLEQAGNWTDSNITVIDEDNITLEYFSADYPAVGEDKFITITG